MFQNYSVTSTINHKNNNNQLNLQKQTTKKYQCSTEKYQCCNTICGKCMKIEQEEYAKKYNYHPGSNYKCRVLNEEIDRALDNLF
jgi:hypothetical protein